MYVEADVLYSYLKPSDWLKQHAKIILNEHKLITSVITITEIELVAKRDFNNDFANRVLEELEKIKNLKFIPLGIEIAKKAIEYRKKFNLNIFDALHAATAYQHDKKIISTDKMYNLIDELKRIDPRILSGINDLPRKP